MNEKHDMVLDKMYPSGAEEWKCLTCGRRMLISWEPKFRRTVLQAGNPNVSHGGFKGSLPMGDTDEKTLRDESEVPFDQSRLAPWEAWIEETKLENLWDSDDQ